MGMLEQFIDRTDQLDYSDTVEIEDAEEEAPNCLQLLYPSPLQFGSQTLTHALQRHPLCSPISVLELQPGEENDMDIQGLAVWDDHVVQIIGVNNSIPPDQVAFTLEVAHCNQEDKHAIRHHQSHVLLVYAGRCDILLFQYYTLTIVAGVLADTNASVVLNLPACACIPATLVSPTMNPELHTTEDDLLLVLLYTGYVKYFKEGLPGCWVRTMTGTILGVPDFATFLPEITDAEDYMFIIGDIFSYLINSQALCDEGHTLSINGEIFVLRRPNAIEYFLERDGPLFVLQQH
ncbi:hypothetical protein [Teredinibacter haidensis]|uniref:hypothetical protein n=1 Tax=Teredinibacter haidensis TaxID=2731755 RepID=UPI00094903E7|nr:hypothetical protein [Teredinibacter haidensis]